jgi:DNA-directed RNA polymerase beta' subunit
MEFEDEIKAALSCIQNNWLEACTHLIDNEMGKKTGFIRSEIVGGPFQFSARAVITLDPLLNINEIAVPYNMLLGAYKYKVAHMLSTRCQMTLEESCRFIDENERDPMVVKMLDEIVDKGVWCVMLREPTNNLASIELVKVKYYKFEEADDTVSLTIEPLAGLNADFDGDQLDYYFLDEFGFECFKPFMYSCMMNYVTGDVQLSLREWFAICAGRMTE